MKLYTFDRFRTLGIPGVEHIKPEAFLQRLEDLRNADWVLFPEHWQVNTLHYALGCRLFPSVASYHIGHNKVEQTRVLQALAPAHVPQTVITAPTDNAVEAVLDGFRFPVIVKEIRSARGEGVRLIKTAREFRDYAGTADQLYVQERLPIDRDLRVVWVGDDLLAAYWRIAPEGEFLNNVARGGKVSYEPAPTAALELVTYVTQTLGLDHAGFDVAVVDGHPYLLEFNVRFGNQALPIAQAAVTDAIHRYLVRRARECRTTVYRRVSLVREQ